MQSAEVKFVVSLQDGTLTDRMNLAWIALRGNLVFIQREIKDCANTSNTVRKT